MKRKREKGPMVVPINDNTYHPLPSIKTVAADNAKKVGFNCVMKNGVLFFLTTNNDEINQIISWLMKNYGQEEHRGKLKVTAIPFSYGFSSSLKDIQLTQQLADELVDEDIER